MSRPGPLPAGVLGELDGMVRRLEEAGLAEQAGRVRQARQQAARDPQAAVRVLLELAAEVAAKAPRRRGTR